MDRRSRNLFLRTAFLALFALVFLLQSSPAFAARAPINVSCGPLQPVADLRREALIIVNYQYPNATASFNRDYVRLNMERAEEGLCRAGFNIIKIENGTKAEIQHSLRVFKGNIRGAEVGLIYYSGHGAVVGEDRILTAEFSDAKEYVSFTEIDPVTVSWSELKDTMRHQYRMIAIIMSDACRDEPIKVDVPPGLSSADLRFSAYWFSVGRSDQAGAGGELDENARGTSPTLFSSSTFRWMVEPGSSIEFIKNQVGEDFEQFSPPLPSPRLEISASPKIRHYRFVPDPLARDAPVSKAAIVKPAKTVFPTGGGLGIGSIAQFAELVTDHRYRLLYWRLKNGAVPPTKISALSFYRGLRALNDGDTLSALKAFKVAASGPASEITSEANTNIGWLLATGRVGQPDIVQAMDHWERASATGSDAAAVSLGVVYRADKGFNWGVTANPARAAELFRRASRSLPAATADLAYMYYEGMGVQADKELALNLFREAAEFNYPGALLWLSGLEWDTDRSAAVANLRLAAELEDPVAVRFWAQRFQAGEVADTFPNVMKSLKIAAETGEPSAQFWYAWFLECQFGQDGNPETYQQVKSLLISSAQAGYDSDMAGGADQPNARDELSRILKYEQAGVPLKIVEGCPAVSIPPMP